MIDILPIQPIVVVLNSAIAFLPNLIAAVIILLIGWIAGKIVSRVTREIMVRGKVDSHVGKTNKKIKLSEIFPLILEWLVYLAFIQAALSAEVLGISALEAFVGTVMAFIPRVIGSVIVIIVGYVIAEYVKIGVEKEKLAYSQIMSRVLFWLIIYVAMAVALDLIQITPLLGQLLLIMTGAIGIGIAIALGLGLKGIVAQEAKKWFKKSR